MIIDYHDSRVTLKESIHFADRTINQTMINDFSLFPEHRDHPYLFYFNILKCAKVKSITSGCDTEMVNHSNLLIRLNLWLNTI